MNKIIYIIIITFIILSAGLVSAVGSDVDTLPVHWVGFDSASLKGNVTVLTPDNATAFFQYKETGDVDWINSTQTEFVNVTGEYILNIFNLKSNTNYTYRAVLDAEVFVESLIEENFTTNKSPSIEYDSTSNILTDSITFTFN